MAARIAAMSLQETYMCSKNQVSNLLLIKIREFFVYLIWLTLLKPIIYCPGYHMHFQVLDRLAHSLPLLYWDCARVRVGCLLDHAGEGLYRQTEFEHFGSGQVAELSDWALGADQDVAWEYGFSYDKAVGVILEEKN